MVIVGLELGLVPPPVRDNPALSAAVEQQSIREMYLAITRARYRVVFAIGRGASPNELLNDCVNAVLVNLGKQDAR